MTDEIPLNMVETGKSCRISGIKAGRGLLRRLKEMGFNKGTRLVVAKAQHHGPLILRINNSRIAIGRGMAMKIMVIKETQNLKSSR